MEVLAAVRIPATGFVVLSVVGNGKLTLVGQVGIDPQEQIRPVQLVPQLEAVAHDPALQ